MDKIIAIAIGLFIMGCGSDSKNKNVPVTLARPPVITTTISTGEIYENRDFNAFSKYLKKEVIKSPIAGYLEKVSGNPGERVRRGQMLFVLQTPESRALANVRLKNDSLLDFQGVVRVSAPKDGIINMINYQEGAFVQQGEQLAGLTAINSLVFVMNVPFENADEVKKGMKLQVTLPDGKKVNAQVGDQLPVVNTSTQVQSFILRPDSIFFIPENLNAIVSVKTNLKSGVQRIDKQAILTNETQTSFWVMKLINDTTAVKVDIEKGTASSGMVEIKSPSFSDQDRLLLKGQYGLPDTAYVKVKRP